MGLQDTSLNNNDNNAKWHSAVQARRLAKPGDIFCAQCVTPCICPRGVSSFGNKLILRERLRLSADKGDIGRGNEWIREIQIPVDGLKSWLTYSY